MRAKTILPEEVRAARQYYCKVKAQHGICINLGCCRNVVEDQSRCEKCQAKNREHQRCHVARGKADKGRSE